MCSFRKTDKYGTKRWYNLDGFINRDHDLPAMEDANYNKEWWTASRPRFACY